jgi:hypothetical protein
MLTYALQEQFDILVTKSGQVEDLIESLIKKAKIPSEEEAGRLRIYETSNHKFFRELPRDYPVISINDYTSVVAERIPTEDAEVKDLTQFISVFQFHGEPSRAHGIPFRFLLKEGEKFSDTKARLEKRTGLKGKSFEKIKFAVVRRAQFSRPQYLTDGKHFLICAVVDEKLTLWQTPSFGTWQSMRTTALPWTTPTGRGRYVTVPGTCFSRVRGRLRAGVAG